MTKAKKWFMRSYIWLILALMYIPLIVLFIYSFTTGPMGDWNNGFSFQLYADLFTGDHSGDIMNALLNTVIIALVSGLLALVLGTLGAIGIDKLKKRMRNGISTVAKLPIINAEIITALAFMIFIASLNMQPNWFSIIMAHVSFCTPYVLLAVLPKLQQVNNNSYEAALDLGANPAQALTKVILPQIFPAMASGFLMAVTISIDDFVITQLNKPDAINTLSTYIYDSGVKQPMPAEVRALSVLIFIFALGIMYLAYRMSSKNNKKEQKI